MKFPRSPYDKVGGILYFARMLDKIRLSAAGELPPDYQVNFGKGMDGRCTQYLRVDHAALVERVKKGGTDDEIFEWCATNGRRLTDNDITIWNGFVGKRGYKDEATPVLEESKAKCGLGHRKDIETFFELFEVDEKRKS